MSKKEKRRAKEAAKKVAAAGGGVRLSRSSLSRSKADVACPRAQNCNVCGDTFQSRSKLFQHINETGHALADGAAGTPAGSAGGKGGRKKGKR